MFLVGHTVDHGCCFCVCVLERDNVAYGGGERAEFK